MIVLYQKILKFKKKHLQMIAGCYIMNLQMKNNYH